MSVFINFAARFRTELSIYLGSYYLDVHVKFLLMNIKRCLENTEVGSTNDF